MSADELTACLEQVLSNHGFEFSRYDIHRCLLDISSKVSKPGPVGPTGATGSPGPMGMRGQDAWDKYAWDLQEEGLVNLRWKGIDFVCPIDKNSVPTFPTGELTYGDLAFIETVYGKSVINRMAVFWRREYDAKMDMALFTNEEDLCNLQDINKSNSYPAPLLDC